MMRASCGLLLLLAAGCTSAWNDEQLVYSAEETDKALAPLRPLQQRCYAGSLSQQAKQLVKLEFILDVDKRGTVQSDPRGGYSADPALLECLRTGIDTLRFPAKGERDQVRVGLELKP
jgi:hypothetical protein